MVLGKPVQVRTFVNTLTSQGVAVWWPKSQLAPGELWEEAIATGLRQSDTLALMVAPDSLHRPAILFELGAGVGMGKRMVPIPAEEMRTADIPFPLRSRSSLLQKSPEKTALISLEATRAERSCRPKEVLRT
jgi:hypothetical protein